ncbi:DUF349 domain-containing protein [Serinicoccus sp. LYQ131]|uniref:DUF349 domain-containing protein n=1 Tax=Serinicoccus sp. LYQ131 TaxID=3378797 RepID=UPI00385285CE
MSEQTPTTPESEEPTATEPEAVQTAPDEVQPDTSVTEQPTDVQPTAEEAEAAPEAEPEAAPEAESQVEPTPAPEPEATPEPDPEPEATPEPAAPAAPRPAAPSPSMFAARKPAAPRPVTTPRPAAAQPTAAPSDSVKHGRVAEDGTVHVILADGTEREVGSYPEATPDEALAYFARKYDELAANADLLTARLAGTEVSAHDARKSLAHLKEQIGDAHVVGDLAALEATVARLEESVAAKAAVEAEAKAAAKAEAGVRREKLVAQAEKLAATDPAKMQWKQSSARIRELLDEWKSHQRSGPRLDKDVENALWQRFSAARSSFDKMRKTWFAQLDEEHASARSVKERLVQDAEALATSKDWGATAGAFKRLMQEWKQAGRASRSDDDALWARFKAAQDSFFDAKDEVVAAEEAEFTENLKVKEALLVEAEAITIDEAHLEQAKGELRKLQERWDAAGKVPRADIRRVENRLRAVEQQVRDLEDKQWKRSDPELNARAQSMVDQLERAVQGLESDLAAATAAGDDKAASSLEAELATKKIWLDSARGGLD